MPFCCKLGKIEVWYISSCSWINSMTVFRIFSMMRFKSGEGMFAPRLASRRCFNPPTRFMKNSSRLDVQMVKNRSRSRSGIDGICAWRRTRRLNSNQLSSRLKNSSEDKSATEKSNRLLRFRFFFLVVVEFMSVSLMSAILHPATVFTAEK